MWKFTKCDKCWREYIWFRCNNWCDDIKTEPVKKPKDNIPKEIKVKEVKVVGEELIIPKQVETSEEIFHWIKLYTSSYLNNKMKIHLNSIKKEIPCIRVWEKYILKEDIIKQFKESLS